MDSRIQTEIYEYAQDNGFIAGICSAVPFEGLDGVLAKTETPFVNYSAERRVNPVYSMENCKSIIAVLVSYNKMVNVKRDEFPRGNFSLSVCGRDYHEVIRELLAGLARHLARIVDFEYKIYVDTGPLVEREILYRAKLAWRGKNFCAVSDTIGSMFNCGYMLTNIDFDISTKSDSFNDYLENQARQAGDASACTDNAPVSGLKKLPDSRCGDCALCVSACPAACLGEDVFKYERCVSYLTQKKGDLSDEEKALIGKNLYGCDICQLVCPYNAGKEVGEINDADEIYPRLDSILSLTKREFSQKYSNRAFYWRGLKLLKRNAEIVCANIMRG